MRRVVVTGIGAVSPLGTNSAQSWDNLIAGKSGAGRIRGFPIDDLPCHIACHVDESEYVDEGEPAFDPNQWLPAKEQKRVDKFIVFGIAAAQMAIADSGWQAETEAQQNRTGVLVGAGIGGLDSIYQTSLTLAEKGPRRVSPFFVPGALINLISGHVAINNHYKGPNHAVVTACSTGAHAIGDAARLIALDDADVMIAGGAEAAICRIGIAGFAACRALSTNFNETPERGSRPYDKDRDGFVMGEGAGVVVLEEYGHAKARGANIYAEIIGYGLSGDAYHITSPAEDGDGAYRAMQAALKRSGLAPEDIGYVNAHGTSTPLGDEIELRAVERLFGSAAEQLTMSSTKSATGHLLGAAGSLEAIFSILAMQHGICPPTLNLDNPSVETKINLVPHYAQEKSIKAVLSNSFGFGGTNASLVFQAV